MSIAKDYFQYQSKILQSSYEGSVVVGHHGDTGTNRENILADWLKLHLPKSSYPEMGGKIVDSDGNITDQVDIVLYNDSAPRFGAYLKSHYYAEGVVAAIEVKSKLGSGELNDAIDNLHKVKDCVLSNKTTFSIGEPSKNIMTGIFAFELGFASAENLIVALNKYEKSGKNPVDFICINQKTFIVYNPEVKDGKGIWHATDENGKRTALPLGYIEVDSSPECIFRMVLTLSSEAKKNIATAVDLQPYFLDGWKK